jgi:hypothetical protein
MNTEEEASGSHCLFPAKEDLEDISGGWNSCRRLILVVDVKDSNRGKDHATF